MGYVKPYIWSFFLCLFVFLLCSQASNAAYIYLDPTSGTISGTDKLEVKIRINTEGEKPTTTDAIITYDSEKLKVVEVKEPEQSEKFFPRFFLNNKANKVFVGSAILPQGTPQSGDGLIATIIFQGISDGSTIAAVQCEDGKTTDSNITLKKNQRVTDIIDCSKATSSTITVSGVGGGPSPTTGLNSTPKPTSSNGKPSATPKLTTPTPTVLTSPTPTVGPSLTPTSAPTPSTLPETGNIEPTTLAISIGLGLTLLSIIIKILL